MSWYLHDRQEVSSQQANQTPEVRVALKVKRQTPSPSPQHSKNLCPCQGLS